MAKNETPPEAPKDTPAPAAEPTVAPAPAASAKNKDPRQSKVRPVGAWRIVKKTSPQVFFALARLHAWDKFSGAHEDHFDAHVRDLADPANHKVEAHFARSDLRPSFFAAAAAYHGWPVGHVLSPEDYQTQLKAALTARVG